MLLLLFLHNTPTIYWELKSVIKQCRIQWVYQHNWTYWDALFARLPLCFASLHLARCIVWRLIAVVQESSLSRIFNNQYCVSEQITVYTKKHYAPLEAARSRAPAGEKRIAERTAVLAFHCLWFRRVIIALGCMCRSSRIFRVNLLLWANNSHRNDKK